MAEDRVVCIKNFRRVNDWLFRGGQPEVGEGELDYLRELGVKTIVCLRWNSQSIEYEQRQALAMGFNFIYLPLTYWILPKKKEIEQFFSIVDDESMRPIFLHCKHGSDRTGLLCAFYRIARDGWSADLAYGEMKGAGFHNIRMRHFKWAVYSFARRADLHKGPFNNNCHMS